MSVEIMGKIWGMSLPHQQKMVLLAMADHADHEGKHIYPSLGLLAWKTDYSVRQVRRIVGQLVDQKILVRRTSASGRPSLYEIRVASAPQKPPFRKRPDHPAGDNLGHHDLGHHDLGHHDLGHGVLDLGHGVLPTPDIAMSAESSFEPNTEPSPRGEQEDIEPETPLTVDTLIDGWNEICGAVGLPHITPRGRKNKTLREKVKLRIREQPERDFWGGVFSAITTIPFYRGDNDRGWKCDLDYVVRNDRNALKIYERYCHG